MAWLLRDGDVLASLETADGPRQRRLNPFERLVQRQGVRIALSPIDALQGPAGHDELVDHLALAAREGRAGERHLNRLEMRNPPGQIGHDSPQGRCRVERP